MRLTGLRLYDVDYACDYDPESGLSSFVWYDDEYMPARQTTLVLRLEKGQQSLPVYLSSLGHDSDRKNFKVRLRLSDHPSNDPDNLSAKC